MRPFLVVYASRHGNARRVAERVADRIRTLRREAQLQDARTEALPPLERYSAAILVSGVHLGHHGREMVRFVRSRRDELERLPVLLLPVTLTGAAASDPRRTDLERAEAEQELRSSAESFALETGWRPRRCFPVAGGLHERARGPLTSFLVRRLAPCGSLPEELTREIVFTDWTALNREVDALVRQAIERSSGAETPVAPSGRSPLRTAVEPAPRAP